MLTLKKLFIKNFKAFHEEQVIPLERITLIFGKNSAGKSTILHAVALLRQILQTSGKLDMGQLILANKQLNLGSLDEIRFDHDSNNIPTISVECMVTNPFGSLVPDHVLGSQLIFNYDDDEFTDIEDEGDSYNYEEDSDCEPEFYHFSDEDGNQYESGVGYPKSTTQRVNLPITPPNGPENPWWASSQKRQDIEWPGSLDEDPDRMFSYLPKLQYGDLLRVSWKLQDGSHSLQIILNNETITQYENLGLEASGDAINKSGRPQLQTLFPAHPLIRRTRELLYRCAIRQGNKNKEERSKEHKNRSRTQFHRFFDEWFETRLKKLRLTPYECLYPDQESLHVNLCLEPIAEVNFPEYLHTACRDVFIADLAPNEQSGTRYDAVRQEMTKLFDAVAQAHLGWMPSNLHYLILKEIGNCLGTDYIPAHRPPPPRDVTKTRISEWITQGASTLSWIQLFDEKVLGRFNEWLDYIGVGITAVCRKLEIHDPDASRNPIAHDPQIVFTKPGRNLRSSHADLGYGVGQLVPILVAGSSSGSQGIKIVEQPEAQVHPGLQAQMGDFFIGQSSNWLIETHSEHLILRILRRIRETHAVPLEPNKREEDPRDWVEMESQASNMEMPVEVPGPLRLHASEISVVYIESGGNGSEAIILPATKDGGFSKPWPGGFFEEQFKEL